MFEPSINWFGDDEQRSRWLKKAQSHEILGCYAQTEFGHGSNVRGLETTAEYDPETETFVVNSPTITAGKCWPGELGKTANHAVFHARLISKGKDHGVQTFFAQIRDMETHHPLPGLEIGEIGPKYGYVTKDNGYMYFRNFRIPRGNILKRYINVTKDGEVTKHGNPKFAYSVMTLNRLGILNVSWWYLAGGATIAIRYSHIRK